MAWELLPVDYKDAVWSGLKKYSQIDNDDGTISLQDVTVYTNKEKSFFGALQANRMNEALNTIMSMVENGTDLYEAFKIYFDTQKALFESQMAADFKAFSEYVDSLEKQGDEIISEIKTDYRAEMDEYEALQEQLFNVWFESIRGKLSGDVATNLQKEIDELDTKVDGFINKTTTFSADGTSLIEAWGTSRREVTFNADGNITEKLYKNDILIHTKVTKFTDGGLVIKEEVT